jgi:hypothetical protein
MNPLAYEDMALIRPAELLADAARPGPPVLVRLALDHNSRSQPAQQRAPSSIASLGAKLQARLTRYRAHALDRTRRNHLLVIGAPR